VTVHDLPLLPAAEAGGTAELLKLITFLSPGFPVGAFSYSHGLEWQIDCNAIRSAAALQAWTADLLAAGSGWNDAVLLAESYRAVMADDGPRLDGAAGLAAALSASRERHLEATSQGRAFLDAVAAAWPCSAGDRLEGREFVTYPVAVGAIAAGHGIALADVLPAFLNSFTANLVSVGVRLIPIGQNAGLAVVAALHPLIAATAMRAARSMLDDLGSATVVSDIASMRHENQYSRVFRT
jgi:urease accessory protein